MKKGIIRLILALVVVFLVVRLCTSSFGNVINLPGGMGGSDSDGSGGWFSPKEKTNESSTVNDVTLDIKDLERELGIGTEKNQSPTINIPSSSSTTSTSTSSSTPLSFKGIPMTGSLSAFGQELVKAGFRSNGNGTYTGDFAGYSDCKLTVVGNPVQGVRVDFPVIKDWDSLEKSYDSLQASLTQKYGIEPTTEKNSNLAVYNLPGGTINLDADVKNRSSWHVILEYSALSPALIDTTPSRNPIDDL